MNPAYTLFQEAAEKNKQLYTLLRFACRCDTATAFIVNDYNPTVAFLAAQNKSIQILSMIETDKSVLEKFGKLSGEIESELKFSLVNGDIDETDLLYIDTPAEGNYRAMELGRYESKVKKYIILSNTVKNAHVANNNIKMPDNVPAIGLVHGINHFLQLNDKWFILEHDDLDPGVTVLVRRDNATL